MLTNQQRELIENFDAESASYIFRIMDWQWFYLGRSPTAFEIRESFSSLLQSAELAAHRDPSREAYVTTGRLQVFANVKDASPWFHLSFIPITSSSDEIEV